MYSQQNKASEFILNKDKETITSIMSSVEGRWFIMRMLDGCQVLNSPNTNDTVTILINEGKRKIGLMLLQKINEIGVDGVKLKQQAEMEYAETMEKIKKWRENDYNET